MMPVASRREYHLKWCSQKDVHAERLHMALVEGGHQVGLYRTFYPSCGHEHLTVMVDRRTAPLLPEGVYMKAIWLAWPAERTEDYLALYGQGMSLRGGHSANQVERVR